MKFLSLLKNTNVRRSSSSSSWAWPSCHQQPKTLSFRANNDVKFKTINSTIYSNSTVLESPESIFTESLECASFSTVSGDSIETVIRGLRSDRLFFESKETSSIFEAKASGSLFKDSMVLSMDSLNPSVDFRKSMEEMVEAHGVKNWEGLEELLGLYLKVNVKSNHGYIVDAFVDLVVGFGLVPSHSHPPPSNEEEFDAPSH